MGQSREAPISIAFGIAATSAALTATPVAAQPYTLSNPYGWPCPPGYEGKGHPPAVCSIINTFPSAAERDRLKAKAVRSAAKWQADLAKEKQREQERSWARQAEEEHQRAEEARKLEAQRFEAERKQEAGRAEAERQQRAEREQRDREAAWYPETGRQYREAEQKKHLAEGAEEAEEARKREAQRAESPELREALKRQNVDDRLRTAYLWYSYVQLCNQARQGYLASDINDVELKRARTAANAIEKDAIANNPAINPDKSGSSELRGGPPREKKDVQTCTGHASLYEPR